LGAGTPPRPARGAAGAIPPKRRGMARIPSKWRPSIRPQARLAGLAWPGPLAPCDKGMAPKAAALGNPDPTDRPIKATDACLGASEGNTGPFLGRARGLGKPARKRDQKFLGPPLAAKP
jgi:hypothetical protein